MCRQTLTTHEIYYILSIYYSVKVAIIEITIFLKNMFPLLFCLTVYMVYTKEYDQTTIIAKQHQKHTQNNNTEMFRNH